MEELIIYLSFFHQIVLLLSLAIVAATLVRLYFDFFFITYSPGQNIQRNI